MPGNVSDTYSVASRCAARSPRPSRHIFARRNACRAPSNDDYRLVEQDAKWACYSERNRGEDWARRSRALSRPRVPCFIPHRDLLAAVLKKPSLTTIQNLVEVGALSLKVWPTGTVIYHRASNGKAIKRSDCRHVHSIVTVDCAYCEVCNRVVRAFGEADGMWRVSHVGSNTGIGCCCSPAGNRFDLLTWGRFVEASVASELLLQSSSDGRNVECGSELRTTPFHQIHTNCQTVQPRFTHHFGQSGRKLPCARTSAESSRVAPRNWKTMHVNQILERMTLWPTGLLLCFLVARGRSSPDILGRNDLNCFSRFCWVRANIPQTQTLAGFAFSAIAPCRCACRFSRLASAWEWELHWKTGDFIF